MSAVLLARYEVSDRARFIEVFDAFEAEREAAGAVARALLASADEPGALVAMIEFPTREAARTFARSSARAAALERASVTDRTDEILDVERPSGRGRRRSGSRSSPSSASATSSTRRRSAAGGRGSTRPPRRSGAAWSGTSTRRPAAAGWPRCSRRRSV